MRLSSKSLLWSWLVLLIILGGLVYSAYSKINKESLVSLLNEQVERNYPGAKLSIGEVDYSFSFDFTVNFKNLTISRNDEILAKSSELQLKIPSWLILLNRGNAQVNISSLEVYVSSNEDEKSFNNQNKIPGNRTSKVSINLPKYLLDAHYTLRAKDVSVVEAKSNRHLLTFSKFLVREFQYGKNSAFEVNIPITISHKGKKYFSDLWLFGDVTPQAEPWPINYRGEFKTRESVEGIRFDDLVIDGKSFFNPKDVDITSSFDLLIEKNKTGKGEVEVKLNELNLKIKLFEFPLDFLNVVQEDIRSPYWTKVEGLAAGEIRFNRTFEGRKATTLLIDLNFPGEFSLSPDLNVPGNWNLRFDNEKWDIIFKESSDKIAYSKTSYPNNNVFNEQLELLGLDLKSSLTSVAPIAKYVEKTLSSHHSTKIILKNCTNGNLSVNGTFHYGESSSQKFYHSELFENDSFLKVDYQNTYKDETFFAEFKQFHWNSFYRFFQPFLSLEEGALNGSIKGKWQEHWSDGKWTLKLELNDLKNLSGTFSDLNQELLSYFNLDGNEYLKRSWNLNVVKNKININTISLDSSDPAIISGALASLNNAKSYLTLKYPKNKKWKPVKKDVTNVFWKKEVTP